MTTTTAIGVAIPRLGMARKVSLTQGRLGPEIERNFYAVDPMMLRAAQPIRIVVDLCHGDTILGDVVSLQLRGGQLWATAELHGDPPPADASPLYWSVASDSHRDGSDGVIKRVAVTDQPAMICTSPLKFLPGELSARNIERWRSLRLVDDNLRDALDTAATAKASRRGALVIVTDTRAAVRPWASGPIPARARTRPGGPWIHGGGRVLSVR